MKKSKLLIEAIAIVLGIVLIVGLLIVFIKERVETHDASSSSVIEDGTIYIEGMPYHEDLDKNVILVVGLDSYDQEISEGYMNNKLADFIYLLVLDDKEKTLTPVQINRDTMVNYYVLGVRGDIVSTDYGQIALSHTYGDGGLTSLCNVKDAVSGLLKNIHIDNYASLTMDAIPIINDACGGVTVFVEDDFSAIDPSIVMKEEVTLMGQQALTFVRARQSMEEPTNLARMKRQRTYLTSLYNNFIEKSKEQDTFAPTMLDSVKDYMVSNANTADLQKLLNMARDYTLNETIVLEGEVTTGNKYIEYYVQDKNINKVLKQTKLFVE